MRAILLLCCSTVCSALFAADHLILVAPDNFDKAATLMFKAIDEFDGPMLQLVRERIPIIESGPIREKQKQDYLRRIEFLSQATDYFVSFCAQMSPTGVRKLTEHGRPQGWLGLLEFPAGNSGLVVEGFGHIRHGFKDDADMLRAFAELDGAIARFQKCPQCQRFFLAASTYRTLQWVSSATQNWEIEGGSQTVAPTSAGLAHYFPAGTALRESAESGTLRDPVGNPIGLRPMPSEPTVSPRTVELLSDVATNDFWERYLESAITAAR